VARPRRLQIDEDIRFHERLWRAQRVAWGMAGVVLLLGVLGLFSQGLLDRRSATSEDGLLTVSLGRFARAEATRQFSVSVDPAAVRDGRVRLRLGSEYAGGVRFDAISPQPSSVSAAGDWFVYEFEVEEGSGLVVHFHVTHVDRWMHTARFRVGDGPEVRLSQFVFP
jgi:hypothetical protein